MSDDLLTQADAWSDEDPAYVPGGIIKRLAARVRELEAELERERVRLAGCGVAALQNTRQSIAEQRIAPDAYGYSGSYAEVCIAVDREIEWRERAERAEAERDALRAENERLRALLREARLAYWVEIDRTSIPSDPPDELLERIDAALAGEKTC